MRPASFPENEIIIADTKSGFNVAQCPGNSGATLMGGFKTIVLKAMVQSENDQKVSAQCANAGKSSEAIMEKIGEGKECPSEEDDDGNFLEEEARTGLRSQKRKLLSTRRSNPRFQQVRVSGIFRRVLLKRRPRR